MKQMMLLLLGIILVPCVTPAQTTQTEANPVSDFVRQVVERESKIIVAAAEEMPADKYSYHPTPAQMTFGHLVVHMVGSNYGLCSEISGIESPKQEKLSETDPKDSLVGALKSSFDFCTTALAKVDDSHLGDPLTLFGQWQTTRAGAMIALTDDFYDHYSMAAMYLRLNGLLPPTAQHQKKG
ncbi:MAG TPA: DinB family protein [Candidatus Acidoferrum sp.]|nr:DinB family protein [Candidatus Acidoferrum sp.]